jgi:hypothetical protein
VVPACVEAGGCGEVTTGGGNDEGIETSDVEFVKFDVEGIVEGVGVAMGVTSSSPVFVLVVVTAETTDSEAGGGGTGLVLLASLGVTTTGTRRLTNTSNPCILTNPLTAAPTIVFPLIIPLLIPPELPPPPEVHPRIELNAALSSPFNLLNGFFLSFSAKSIINCGGANFIPGEVLKRDCEV